MIVLASGGFDPLHVGHLDYLLAASVHGKLVVAVNSDEWLIRKKGYCFMSQQERIRILGELRFVHAAITAADADNTVASTICALRPDVFANGGDRTEPNPLEDAACRAVGCRQIFGCGGGKVQSSSGLVNQAMLRPLGISKSS